MEIKEQETIKIFYRLFLKTVFKRNWGFFMTYLLTEEQKMILEICRKIVEERIIPVRAEYDEKKIFPTDILKEIGKSDLFRLFIP